MHQSTASNIPGRVIALFILLAPLFISALVSTGIAASPSQTFAVAPLPSTALAAPELSTSTQALKVKTPKLDSTMASLAAAARVSIAGATDLARSQSLRVSNGRVHVQIVTHAASLNRIANAVTGNGG